jgi:hypothetical protein
MWLESLERQARAVIRLMIMRLVPLLRHLCHDHDLNAPDHRPPLGHAYQFDLDTDTGQLFADRLLAFLRQRLAL